jgi:hypothetical protein
VPKAAAQHAQPGTVDVIDEHHHHRRARSRCRMAFPRLGRTLLGATARCVATQDVTGPAVMTPSGADLAGSRHERESLTRL